MRRDPCSSPESGPDNRIREDLSRPEAYPHPVEEVEILQTHVSFLFFAGERVYKVKKPLDLGFLDFTSRESRLHYCREELRLNRRLAPRTYIEVAPVTEGEDGRLCVGGAGPVVDHAVVMERLPAHRMMDRFLARGALDNAMLMALARLLARFHQGAARGPGVDEHGEIESVRRNVKENFEQLAPYAGDGPEALCSERLLEHVASEARSFLARNEDLFRRRIEEGRIRDGHGDLHCGNICFLPEEIVIFDCIEFSERFRCGDVACDLAFLAMDLDRRGYRAFSAYLARRYAELVDDAELHAVLDFYKGYRAMVRAKVAAFRSATEALSSDEREAARREARAYLQLAASYVLPPALLLTCGLPASGKSVAARRLAKAFHAVLLRSDVVRKRLAGMAPAQRSREGFESGIYTPAHSDATYAALLDRARAELASGRTVVVDATFTQAKRRLPFVELARECGVPLIAVELRCPEEEIRRRMAQRAGDPREVSDADWEVYRRARESFEPPRELPAERHLEFPGTSAAEDLALAVTERLLPAGDEGA